MVLKRDNFWWEDRGCLVEEVQHKTVAPICQHDIAAATTTTTAPFSCSAVGGQEYDGYCYLYSKNRTNTWPDAEADCVSYGGHLASVHSKAEDSFLYNLIGIYASPIWLGASDIDQEVGRISNFFS
jgi:hypothetical protein